MKQPNFCNSMYCSRTFSELQKRRKFLSMMFSFARRFDVPRYLFPVVPCEWYFVHLGCLLSDLGRVLSVCCQSAGTECCLYGFFTILTLLVRYWVSFVKVEFVLSECCWYGVSIEYLLSKFCWDGVGIECLLTKCCWYGVGIECVLSKCCWYEGCRLSDLLSLHRDIFSVLFCE